MKNKAADLWKEDIIGKELKLWHYWQFAWFCHKNV